MQGSLALLAAGDDPWDLQPRHGTLIAGMIYDRELMEGNNAINSPREKFRQVRSAWHVLGWSHALEQAQVSIVWGREFEGNLF